jgi:ribosomal protein S18 acetylase RimI-like enzyme
MKTEIVPFTETMIPEAGRLLAARHARNHKKLPLIPARFEEPQVAEKAVRAMWEKKLKHGYAAFCDGKMIAYLIGEYMVNDWGRCGYVYLPGYALADGEAPSTLQDVYARLGEDWVRNGVFSHAAYISAADRLILDAFFDMGFGKERVDGLMALQTIDIPTVDEIAGVTIRLAGKGDNDHLGNLSHIIADALSHEPYWHPTPPEVYFELKEGWSELADDPEWKIWMAFEHDQALGMVGFRPEPEDDGQMLASPSTVYLSVGATRPEARGRGIATLLTWRGLEQMRQEGYEICYTNWISPNILASRFWPRYGFQDVSYRLSKQINPIITWTRRGV